MWVVYSTYLCWWIFLGLLDHNFAVVEFGNFGLLRVWSEHGLNNTVLLLCCAIAWNGQELRSSQWIWKHSGWAFALCGDCVRWCPTLLLWTWRRIAFISFVYRMIEALEVNFRHGSEGFWFFSFGVSVLTGASFWCWFCTRRRIWWLFIGLKSNREDLITVLHYHFSRNHLDWHSLNLVPYHRATEYILLIGVVLNHLQ